jgi:hypothetical protein
MKDKVELREHDFMINADAIGINGALLHGVTYWLNLHCTLNHSRLLRSIQSTVYASHKL